MVERQSSALWKFSLVCGWLCLSFELIAGLFIIIENIIRTKLCIGPMHYFLLPLMKSTNVSFKQVNSLDQRDDLLKLAEFKLDLMSAALKMLSDGSMNASVKLANCTLDDKRQSIQKATPRSVILHNLLFMRVRPRVYKHISFISILLKPQLFQCRSS